MKVRFYLRYHSLFGQTLWINGSCAELGNEDPAKAIPMTYLNEEYWYCIVDIKRKKLKENIRYRYFHKEAGGELIRDGEEERWIGEFKKNCRELQVVDTWIPAGQFENVFLTAPFRDVYFAGNTGSKGKGQASEKKVSHIFKVKAPLLGKNESVCLLGEGDSLGAWSEVKPIVLEKEGNWWIAKVNLSLAGFPVHYKYGVYNSNKRRFVEFEDGENRILYSEAAKNKITLVQDGFLRVSNVEWKAAGLAVPLFSLKSKQSFGVGEFTDLKQLVNWAQKTGLKCIQLLPVNDTTSTGTWTDSYPYSAISSFALHPIYINLSRLAGKQKVESLAIVKQRQLELNVLPGLDYETVMKLKTTVLKELYELMSRDCFESDSYKSFFEKNKEWLQPYAAFCFFRDHYGSSDTTNWGTDAVYNAEAIASMFLPEHAFYTPIGYYCFVQYQLHLQFREAADYARKKGIVLKGDLPIGVNRNSCESWYLPELFNKNWQAGAPPDDFTPIGQNWGFPTYNWNTIRETGYKWWKDRFSQMSQYFDAFRIDHILGFFRIWSIPIHAVQGIMGRFIPAKPILLEEFTEHGLWFDQARFCRPFINDEVLDVVFRDLSTIVKAQFLQPNENGGYDLIPAFQTQVQVEDYFSKLEGSEEEDRLKQGLLELIADVILFEDESETGQFHFRIHMDRTHSFAHLIPHVQERLKELYEDYFYHRQDQAWKARAEEVLAAIKSSTDMLVCGEDLGMVPACVPEVLSSLGILSLEVQRMPKKAGIEFLELEKAPYLSVVTPGTHDMNTLRGWWQEDKKRTQRFYNEVLGQWGTAPDNCESWIVRAILQQHLNAPSLLIIFMIQDILSMSESLRGEDSVKERINDPADPKHYWRYRMHITLEELIKQKEFNNDLKQMIEASGRN